MRFLITGTARFIGFHLAKRLLDAGHFVTGFDGAKGMVLSAESGKTKEALMLYAVTEKAMGQPAR